jgi:hypothetical protein
MRERERETARIMPSLGIQKDFNKTKRPIHGFKNVTRISDVVK